MPVIKVRDNEPFEVAMKRFKKTASGKIRRRKNFASHCLTKKSAKRRRQLREAQDVAPADQRRVKRLMAGG